MAAMTSPPCIAIFPWGDVLEDFLEPIGLDLQAFTERMTGGWLFGYVAALQSIGWRPILVVASKSVSRPVRLEHSGTGAAIWAVPARRPRPSRWPSLFSARRWAATPVAAFREVLVKEACSAILVQEYEYVRFDRLTALGQKMALPVFASFQGGDRTLSRLEAVVRAKSLNKASGLIVASVAERTRLAAAYPQLRTPVANIPNPLDTAEWRRTDRQTARTELGLDDQTFVAFNHGRISVDRKGLDVLLQAWDRCAEGKLVVVGSGEDDEAFGELVGRSRAGTVDWRRGYVTDRQLVRTWLSAADVYVAASRIEGMPVAPLEAMACGLPVVATDAQGLSDIFIDGELSGGLVVPKNSPGDLAEAISRVRTDHDLRDRMGRAARRRVEAHFSVQSVGSQLGALIAPGEARLEAPAHGDRS
jgi:starch synthase